MGSAETMPVPQIGAVQNVRDHLGMGVAFIKSGFENLIDRLDGRGQQVAAVALLASVSMTACGGGNGGERSPVDLSVQPVGTVSADLLKILNPQEVETHCASLAAKFKLDTFDRGDGTRGVSPRLEYKASVGDRADQRIASDAMGTRFANTDPDLVDREKSAVNCADPYQGVGTLVFLANLQVGGEKVGDLNSRLAKFKVSPDEIDDLAAEYLSLLGETRTDVPEAELRAALDKQREWQNLADMGSQILTGFKPVGVGEYSATNTLQLAKNGMKTGAKDLPVAEFADEKGMFARYDLTSKGEDCPAVSIGFNIGVKGKANGGDKRPGILPNQCEAPTSTAPQGTTPQGTTPGSVPRTTVRVGETTTTLQLPDGTTTTIITGTTTTQPQGTTTTQPRQETTTTQPRQETTTTQPQATTTVPSEGKDHTKSPVTDDRNHPDERVRPNVPDEPVREVPPIPDEVVPNRGDSGTGAVNTVPTPVTTSPPATVPPAQPPNSGTVAPR